MKHSYLTPALLLACGLYAHAQQPAPIAPAPRMPEQTSSLPQLTTSKDWQNPAALRDKLGKQILSRLKGADEASIKAFLASSHNRLLLANWQLAQAEISSATAYDNYRKTVEKNISDRRKQIEKLQQELPELTGTAVESNQYSINKLQGEIAAFEAELAQPMRMADVVKRPRASRLIGLIANDLGWIGEVVYSGECIMPGRMLNMLANMMERYTRMLPDDRIPRDIATATALEYARFGWTVDNACKRAEYFVRNWRQGRLHPQFDTMPLWLRRVVCGWKGDHSSGTPESFTWALNNVNLPDDQYTGCCWRCGYVLNNVYGDIIHGSAYAAAFEGLYIGQHHKYTKEVGGVCGGLSHFGASTACAHGVPGLTMGEPAHCAYVVWVDGKWTPSYSVSWERGLHWRPWLDNWRYSSLHMLTELQSSGQKNATRLSNAYRSLAQIRASQGKDSQAIELYLKAQAAQPRNYQAFREHAELLTSTKAGAAAWEQLNQSVCSSMVPVYAECASEFLRNHVYDNLQKNGASAEQLQKAFVLFWDNIRERGPERWKVQELLERQVALLNKTAKDRDLDHKCSIFEAMLAGSAARPDYLTYAMECGNNLMQKMDETGKSRMLGIMTNAISSGADIDAESRIKAISRIILATEDARDAAAFQSVSKLVAPERSHFNRPIGEFEAFPGKLVSEGGVIYGSSTSRWDHPYTHANVLTHQGGQIHTARDKNPWVAVKLPKHASVSGVVLVVHTSPENWHRLNNVQIQVSETGRDDDWHNAGQLTGKCTQRVVRIDLTAEQPKALYVRVIRPGVQEVFNLDGFFVYGTPAA